MKTTAVKTPNVKTVANPPAIARWENEGGRILPQQPPAPAPPLLPTLTLSSHEHDAR